MTPGVYLALTATIAVAALTPGPAVTAIVARAITDGIRPALAINAGVVTGDLLFFALAAVGMAAAASSLGDLFTVLQWLGAAYLAWQGITLWRFQPRPVTPGVGAPHESNFWRNYGAGLLLMFGHVQALLFYAALLPGFVDFSRLTAWDIALVALTLA
ncbi:MAG: LysE family translocator, partial [Proteobacteria bacterium]|nr:LysE family translocator [Pseudomonadota bacterium]